MIDLVGLAHQHQRIGADVTRAISKVLAHRQFILGPEVEALEAELSHYCGANVVTCANGTDALVLALLAVGLRPGDAVVVPAFTFSATAEAVLLAGGQPVFADVEPLTGLVTHASIVDAARHAKRRGLEVTAVISVDLFGQPVSPEEMLGAATELGASWISDGAQSFGARFAEVPVGQIAPMTTTSFFPSKPLGCYGDGGAVATTSDEQAKTLVSLREHGRGRDRDEIVRLGMNSRLDTIQAAVLREKLKIFDDELERRRAIANHYRSLLGPLARPMEVSPLARSSWSQFTVLLPNRDRVAGALRDVSIASAIYYSVPLHHQPAFEQYAGGIDLPNASWLAAHALSLPMHPYLTTDDVERVSSVVATEARGSLEPHR